MQFRAGRRVVPFSLLAGLALCQAGQVEAARFSVNPTQVVLTPRVTSALLSLKNESNEPLRFQLSASAWDQSPTGEMILQDTEDVIFFPQLLTLGPGEERKVRVAVGDAAARVEKTYRLFVEELPSPEQPRTPGVVRVLTRMGIPVFVRPPTVQVRGELRDLAFAGGRVTFALGNSGNMHFVPEHLVLRALSAEGQPLGERQVDAWYILAGGVRRFSVDVTGISNTPVGQWLVECRVGASTLSERLAAPGKRPLP